jgi:amidophosphoribosyltransferase
MSVILGVYGADAPRYAFIGMRPLIRNPEAERTGIVTNWCIMSGLPDIGKESEETRLSGINEYGEMVFPTSENIGYFYGDMAATQKCYPGEKHPSFKCSPVGNLGEGVTVAFDGFLINTDSIESDTRGRKAFDDLNLVDRPLYSRTMHSDGVNDSEIIYSLLAQSGEESLAGAIRNLRRLEGSFNMIVATPREMAAIRDPRGTRPFYFESFGDSYVFAPETMPIDMIRLSHGKNQTNPYTEVEPGKAVIVSREGAKKVEIFPKAEPSHCIRELIAYARNPSDVFGINVSEFRREAGRRLARKHSDIADRVDLVCSIGDTYSDGFAEQSRKPLLGVLTGLFMLGERYDSGAASGSFDGKYYANPRAVSGKSVALVERAERRDGKKLIAKIEALRRAGATEVHVFMGSESIRATEEGEYPCSYGRIGEDHRTAGELADIVGADTFSFLPVDETYSIIEMFERNPDHFCTGCIRKREPEP